VIYARPPALPPPKTAMGVTLVYETHTTTTDNERGIATGWLPGALSEAGRREAQELGERRRNDDIVAVFSSDLRRAVETSEIAFREMNIPIYYDARLRECNYGAMNGMPVAQFAGQRLLHIDTPFPDGESYRQVVDRTRSFLRDISGRYIDSRIVVIGHSANRWSLEYLVNGVALGELVDAPFNWQPGWEYVVSGVRAKPVS
jgi:broad specificity phosphatase PhoE